MPWKKAVGVDLAAVGHDRRAQRHARGRVVRPGVIVRHRPPDRACVPNLCVPNPVGHGREGRNPPLHGRRPGHLRMGAHGPHFHRVADVGDVGQPRHPRQRHQVTRHGQVQLHDRQQALPARDQLCTPAAAKSVESFIHRCRCVVCEIIHESSPISPGPVGSPATPARRWPASSCRPRREGAARRSPR